MTELDLLRGCDYVINEHIKIRQPTLDEIYRYGEKKYFWLVNTLTISPADIKSMLYDLNIDWEEISDFEVFILLCKSLSLEDTSIIFGDRIDFSKLVVCENTNTNEPVLVEVDSNNNIKYDGILIDSHIYMLFTEYLRKMHGFKKNNERAGNEETKKILIELEREDLKLAQSKEFKSVLKPLIIPMVNCQEFKYNYTSVWELPISLFLDSVKQVQKIKEVGYLMQGIYAGNIDQSKINKKDLQWI